MPNAILPYETYLQVLGLHHDWWTQKLHRDQTCARLRSSWGHGATYEWLPALRPVDTGQVRWAGLSQGGWVGVFHDPLARYGRHDSIINHA